MSSKIFKKSSLGLTLMCMTLGGITFAHSDFNIGHADGITQLDTPTNIKVSKLSYNTGVNLTFDKVSNATSYSVVVKDGEKVILEASHFNVYGGKVSANLSLNKACNYCIEITAIGDGENYSNSEVASTNYLIETNSAVSAGYANFDDFYNIKDNDYFYYYFAGCVTKIDDYTDGDLYLEVAGGRNYFELRIEDFRKGSFSTDEDTKVIRPGTFLGVTGLSGGEVGEAELRDILSFDAQNDDLSYPLGYLKNSQKQSLAVSYNETINGTTDGYNKVNSIDELSVDDVIIIESEDAAVSLNCYYDEGYMEDYYPGSLMTFADRDVIKGNSDFAQCELTLGGEEGAWTLKSEEYNLYLNTNFVDDSYGSYYGLSFDETCFTTWDISFENGNANILSNLANSASLFLIPPWGEFPSEFSCDEQSLAGDKCSVQIYKKGEIVNYEYSINQSDSKNLLSIQFGNFITKDLYDEFNNMSEGSVEYGALYAIASEEFAESDLYWLIDDLNGGLSIEDFLKENTNVHQVDCTPVRVDGYGNLDDSGDYYQYGVSFEHIPTTDLNTEIVVANYVLIDGIYYLFGEGTMQNSVSSLAETYLNKYYSMPELKNYLGILNYLASFAA